MVGKSSMALALKQLSKWGRITGILKHTCDGFSPYTRHVANVLQIPHSHSYLAAAEQAAG